MASGPDDPDILPGAGFGTNTSNTSYTFHNPPKPLEPAQPLIPWGGALPPVHPVITDPRIREQGVQAFKFSVSMPSWKRKVMFGQNPIEDFFPFAAKRCQELNAFRDNAKYAGPNNEGAINTQKLQETLNSLTAFVQNDNLNWSELQKELDSIGDNQPYLKRFLQDTIHSQWGMNAEGFQANANLLGDVTVGEWGDWFGKHEINRVIDTLQATIFHSGMEYIIDPHSGTFKIELTSEDPNNPGQNKTFTLVEGSTPQLHSGSGNTNTTYNLGPDVPAADRDRGLIAMAEMIAHGKQSNNSNTTNISIGNGSPYDLLRLFELLLLQHNMHINIDGNTKNAMLQAMSQAPYDTREFQERWAILSTYSQVFYPGNSDDRLNLMVASPAGKMESLYDKATGEFKGLPPHPEAPKKWKPIAADLKAAMSIYANMPSPALAAATAPTLTIHRPGGP